MRIDGKAIAEEIFQDLSKRVEKLKEKDITPHLVVILVGEDPASAAYVRQKDLKAQLIGAKATIINLESGIKNHELIELIKKLNNDDSVHGIIVQRPLPKSINGEEVNKATDPAKDIDAFLPHSPFTMPLAAAVIKILEKVHGSTPGVDAQKPLGFVDWLKEKNIVVIGKGETGGGPTISLLKKLGATPKVIDSKTQNGQLITEEADIIISTVGRDNIVRSENIKNGVILVGVGMHRGEDGKLHGDYEEDDIKDIAAFYTPIPGGVGPVNVAMLLSNLLQATENFRAL